MRRGRIAVLAAAAACLLTPLAIGATAATAATASPAVQAASTPQPDGGGTGWTLLQNQDGQDIYSDWNINPLTGQDCTVPGAVSYDSTTGDIDLTTNGTADNCADASSPWTISPTAADPTVFIEYEATLPTNTWAALWATGYPGPWPTTGEIDDAEMLGTSSECHTYHYGTPADPLQIGPGDPQRCESGTPGSEAVYGVEWSAGHLTFYVNGVETDQFTNSAISTDPEEIELDNVTGGFDTAPGPQSTLQVQYVRAWERTSSNVQNSGTPTTCLDANSNDYPDNGDAVQLWSCDNNGEQFWQVTSAGQLENATTGECLDANSNDYPDTGDTIQLWTCNGNGEQQWHFTSAGQLENGTTGMCLDANSSDYANDGDNLQLWTCNTNPEQEWQLG